MKTSARWSFRPEALSEEPDSRFCPSPPVLNRVLVPTPTGFEHGELVGMNIPLKPTTEILQLPSDQDSSGRTLGSEELQAIQEALESGTLTVTKGKFGKQLESSFAQLLVC